MGKYIPKNLIIVKGEDKTADIKDFHYLNGTRKVQVTFKSGKSYNYNNSNVEVFKSKEKKDLDKATVVVIDDETFFNIVAIQDFGSYIRLIQSNGNYTTVPSYKVSFEQKKQSEIKLEDTFEYLKNIAQSVGLIVDGKNILAANYSKIDKVSTDSVLFDYLSGSIQDNSPPNAKSIFYPFGFNLSQKKAVENALNNKISVIEGPPGTGKTQTILNIIANAVMNNESVAVVSNNNTAIKNVFDKLADNDVSFISAVLGKRDNKLEFIEKQEKVIPNVGKWSDYSSRRVESIKQLVQEERMLNQNLATKNKLSELTQEYDALQKEQKYFDESINKTDSKEIVQLKQNIPATDILLFAAEVEHRKTQGQGLGFFKKLNWFFKYGLKDFSFYNNATDEIVDYCNQQYYIRRLNELNTEISKNKALLERYDFNEKMKSYATLSMEVLKGVLANKYRSGSHERIYEANDLWKNSSAFIQDYPVILSTTYSLRTSLNSDYVYDYVIIDEASQVDLATGALAFSCARKAVVVGDTKQLPNVVDSNTKAIADSIFQEYSISENYDYARNSILSSVKKVFEKVPSVLLREHYRCAPEIINFCNKSFYDDSLIVLTEENNTRKPMVVYRTVAGNHTRDRVNQRQIDVIRDEVIPAIQLKKGESIGIVTPYRNQADALIKEFKGTGIKADTVDKFQGQERTVMIFSTVDNEIGDFAADPNRLNVAVSRATDQFIVVTDGNENDKTSPIHDLIDYIKYNNYEIIDSKISSIFDNLYKQYGNARNTIIKKYGAVSEYDSENLMYSAIRDVLEEGAYTRYDVATHVPLRHIIQDKTDLTEREKEFTSNANSHLDFLIFSRLSYQPIMAIEVDGYKYHKANTIQMERDHVKDSIMKKYGIPLLRFSTVGSDERRRLIEAFAMYL